MVDFTVRKIEWPSNILRRNNTSIQQHSPLTELDMNFKQLFSIALMISLGSNQLVARSKQEVLDKFEFTEHIMITENDTIYFYLHVKKGASPKHLVLHLQGTLTAPLFSLEREKKGLASYRSFPGDYQLLDDEYCFAVISKSGIPGVMMPDQKMNTQKFHEFNTLDNRVFQADTVIHYITEALYPDLEKIIVYGHSEGAPVAAKLGTINDKITHIGFWAGNALSDLYDFMLFETKAMDQGKILRKEAFQNMALYLDDFQELSEHRNDTSAASGYTNKRWWSYAEPAINHLLQIEVPIFMQVAGNDNSVPIESTFLVPLEFIRLGKDNLTYNICSDCDHAFFITGKRNKSKDMWSEVFMEFIAWTDENS